jgi:acetylglutamate kinase
LLNTNADTAAGEIAAALRARQLVFLTDVPGVRSSAGETLTTLSPHQAAAMTEKGVIEGGMIPKVEACLRGAGAGVYSVIVDGRDEHALLRAADGARVGTTVG